MDLAYGKAYERFRTQVRDFLETQWVNPSVPHSSDFADAQSLFRARATAEGYLYRGIPRQYGGSEQPPDALRGQIIREEFSQVRAPLEVPGVGVGMLVPTLLACGSEAQKDLFIPKTLSGEYLWAQGYSEPDAGSDLASLRTRAVLSGDQWVINGQKVWSSLAQHARFMFALVRTEPNAPRHQGLSYLLLDLKQPGVSVRPLKQLNGGEEFCEVFFDNATTRADWVVGGRGEGWQVSRTTLAHERNGFIGNAEASRTLFDKLVALAKATPRGHGTAIDDPLIREKLLILEGYVASHVYSGLRQFSLAAQGEAPGIIGTMNKLMSTQIGHEVARIARDLMGDEFLLAPALERGGSGSRKWNSQFFGSLGIAIAGGASNIQRNIIAEQGLGLPRDQGKGRTIL